MKKYAIISLCSAILALGALAICFCLFIAQYTIQSALFAQLHAEMPTIPLSNSSSQDKLWDNVISIFCFISIGLAIVSLIALIASFIKREAGWRFLPVTLLLLYLLPWLAILLLRMQG
jgi:hypothetical protein